MKYYSLLLLISFSIITLSSCEKEQNYSCDPEIDKWVKNNLSTIDTINRIELIQKNLSYQKAIFRASSKEQKAKFWYDKLGEVMQLRWSTEELEHIEFLRMSISADWFDEKIKEDTSSYLKIKSFLNDWVNKGQVTFGWSKEQCIGMICRLEKLKDMKGNLDIESKVLAEPDVSPCGCSQESDWCGMYENCVSIGCKETANGCGTLWWHSCDGKCR
jgi:hypothetical protein